MCQARCVHVTDTGCMLTSLSGSEASKRRPAESGADESLVTSPVLITHTLIASSAYYDSDYWHNDPSGTAWGQGYMMAS